MMRKGKAARIAGFIGTFGASVALASFAITGTGAYFTDSNSGNVDGDTGGLALSDTNYNLSFDGLVPGDYETKTVAYHVEGSSDTASDIWLHFPTESGHGYYKFTGAKGGPYAPGGLGRYGHFAVTNSTGDVVFSSWNLANAPAGSTAPTCTDGSSIGHGKGAQPTTANPAPNYCGVPHNIRVATGVQPGDSGSFEITFGVTPRWTAQNSSAANVDFKVVATQPGIQPGNDGIQ